jgi:hypothetical protein
MTFTNSSLTQRGRFRGLHALALAAALSFGIAGTTAFAASGDGQNWGGGKGGQNWGGGKNWGGGPNSGGPNAGGPQGGPKGGGQGWSGGPPKGGNWNQGGNPNWGKGNPNWGNKGAPNWAQQQYGKNWGKGWSSYNNHWNKNWNRRAYVRNWYNRPYYGQFVAGIVLGSLLAAPTVGVVPYAPAPYLCWYWADPYMYRGYWDYCYY